MGDNSLYLYLVVKSTVMKYCSTFFLIFLTLFVAKNASSQSLDALDAKYGFNDAKFGMSPSALPGLKRDYTPSENIIIYKRIPFKVGDIQLSFVTYTFIFNKLVTIQFGSEASNCNELIKTIKAAYGEPNVERQPDGVCRWRGKRVNLLFIDVTKNEKVLFEMNVNNSELLWKQAKAFDKSEALKKRLQGL